MHPALARFTQVLAQTEADATRLRSSGARGVAVLGNLKFDMTPPPGLPAPGLQWRPALRRPVVLAALLPRFNGRGMVGPLDAGWQLAELSLDDLSPFLAQVDAFLPSEIELAALVPGAPIEQALALAAARCRGTAAVKLGPRGCLVWDKVADAPVAVPVIPTHAIDPTGAGDSFCGGFLAGLVETGNPVLAAAYGAVSASLIVSRHGADGALPIDRAACREALARLTSSIARAPMPARPLSA